MRNNEMGSFSVFVMIRLRVAIITGAGERFSLRDGDLKPRRKAKHPMLTLRQVSGRFN